MEITLSMLWNALTATEQEDACNQFWTIDDLDLSQQHAKAIVRLSELLRFRVEFFTGKPAEFKADKLLKWINNESVRELKNEVIQAWVVAHHRDLFTCFLDCAGIPNNRGFIDGDIDPPDGETFARGIAQTLERFPERDVAVYLGWLQLNPQDLWQQIPAAVELSGFDCVGHFRGAGPEESVESGTVETDSEGAYPEQNESSSFTTLDDLLIFTIVASRADEEGAIEVDKCEALIHEIITLNASRQRSLFHLGFFHALFDQEINFSEIPSVNAERRQWYLTGAVFGARRRSSAEAVELLKKYKEITRLVIENQSLPCGRMILPSIYSGLVEGEEFDLVCRWLTEHGQSLSVANKMSIIKQAYDDGAQFLQAGKTEEARMFFEAVNSVLERSRDLPEEFSPFYLASARRKIAQTFQAEGEYVRAQELLNGVINEEDTLAWCPPNALSDLGLIKAGFRSVLQVLPRSSDQENSALSDSLRRGEEEFVSAVEKFSDKAVNGHFCLGIIKTFGDGHSQGGELDRVRHFRKALNGMMREPEIYRDSRITEWTRFLLSLSLLESAEPTEFQRATELVEKSIACDIVFPIDMWERCLEAASVFDDSSLAIKLATYLLEERGNDAYRAIFDAGVISSHRALRHSYLEWVSGSEFPVQSLWHDLKGLLPASLQDQDYESAEIILGEMEMLAEQDESLQGEFIEFLKDSKRYSPAWDVEEAEDTLIRLYELSGNFQEAAAILKSRFFKLRQRGKQQEMRGVYETILSYSLKDQDFSQLEELLEGVAEDEVPEDEVPEDVLQRLRTGEESVSIVYIGGNEVQERHEDILRSELESEYPSLKLEFFFPGWGSNWNRELKKIAPYVKQSHGVVLNPLVRTHFGRHVRKMCDETRPWTSCNGRGKASIKASIILAASVALRLRGEEG